MVLQNRSLTLNYHIRFSPVLASIRTQLSLTSCATLYYHIILELTVTSIKLVP